MKRHPTIACKAAHARKTGLTHVSASCTPARAAGPLAAVQRQHSSTEVESLLATGPRPFDVPAPELLQRLRLLRLLRLLQSCPHPCVELLHRQVLQLTSAPPWQHCDVLQIKRQNESDDQCATFDCDSPPVNCVFKKCGSKVSCNF
jgi:hypothetical protein